MVAIAIAVDRGTVEVAGMPHSRLRLLRVPDMKAERPSRLRLRHAAAVDH